jgi:hypothetical protein
MTPPGLRGLRGFNPPLSKDETPQRGEGGWGKTGAKHPGTPGTPQ